MGPGQWAASVSFKPESSRFDKLKINTDYEKYLHFLLYYCWFDVHRNLKCYLQQAEVHMESEGMYGPIWMYLWEKVWMQHFPLLKKKALEVEVGDQRILSGELLAFFDACVATAPWSDSIAEGEKRTKIASSIQGLVEEHNSNSVTAYRLSLFEALQY